MNSITQLAFDFNSPEQITEKKCGRCQTVKPVAEFGRNKTTSTGYSCYCKPCQRGNSKQNYEKHKEKHNAMARDYARRNREKVLAGKREYYRKKREDILAYHREYYKKNTNYIKSRVQRWYFDEGNRQRRLQYAKDYVKQNYEKVSLNQRRSHHKRRTVMERARGSWTPTQWRELCKKYGNKCLCCGKEEPFIKLTFDHVIPVSKGGDNTIENAQPLCKICNARKGVKDTDYR